MPKLQLGREDLVIRAQLDSEVRSIVSRALRDIERGIARMEDAIIERTEALKRPEEQLYLCDKLELVEDDVIWLELWLQPDSPEMERRRRELGRAIARRGMRPRPGSDEEKSAWLR